MAPFGMTGRPAVLYNPMPMYGTESTQYAVWPAGKRTYSR
jgi:hypothetical protein